MTQVLIRASCVPPDHLAKQGALPETMRKFVGIGDAHYAAKEFVEACINTGILSLHGRVVISIEPLDERASLSELIES